MCQCSRRIQHSRHKANGQILYKGQDFVVEAEAVEEEAHSVDNRGLLQEHVSVVEAGTIIKGTVQTRETREVLRNNVHLAECSNKTQEPTETAITVEDQATLLEIVPRVTAGIQVLEEVGVAEEESPEVEVEIKVEVVVEV